MYFITFDIYLSVLHVFVHKSVKMLWEWLNRWKTRVMKKASCDVRERELWRQVMKTGFMNRLLKIEMVINFCLTKRNHMIVLNLVQQHLLYAFYNTIISGTVHCWTSYHSKFLYTLRDRVNWHYGDVFVLAPCFNNLILEKEWRILT